MIIRLAIPDDAQAISTVLERAFAEVRDLYTSSAFRATVIPPHEVVERMQAGPVWVIEEGENVVGTVAAVGRDQSLYIRGMAIVPEARGKKMGARLLETVEKYAQQNAYRAIGLSTTPYLKRAIYLYEKMGFRIINEGPFEFHGAPLFQMRKMLSID